MSILINQTSTLVEEVELEAEQDLEVALVVALEVVLT